MQDDRSFVKTKTNNNNKKKLKNKEPKKKIIQIFMFNLIFIE